MVEVYYYLPSSEADNVIECGLKLSKWYDREVTLNGESRKCISALLNPKDDTKMLQSPDHTCVKLQVHPRSCYIAERYLRPADTRNTVSPCDGGEACDSGMDELYGRSIIPAYNYVFGSYRLPECLVMTTILPGYIRRYDKRLDSPVLYSNSEELYINNMLEFLGEDDADFKDALLYCYFEKLAAKGRADMIALINERYGAFKDEKGEMPYIVKMPEWMTK